MWIIHSGVSKLDGAPGRGSGRYPLGSGKRPFQGISKSNIVDHIFSVASKNEPSVTNDLLSVSKQYKSSRMDGLDNRLKTKESISRKIKTGKDIRDALRYTIISDDDDFVDNYFSIKRDLETKGYKETKCKNYFEQYKNGLVSHKSVQTNFVNPDGYEFEIQFQTPSSQAVKNKKVRLYEEVRQPTVSVERKAEILQKMIDLAETVEYPKGIDKIKQH